MFSNFSSVAVGSVCHLSKNNTKNFHFVLLTSLELQSSCDVQVVLSFGAYLGMGQDTGWMLKAAAVVVVTVGVVVTDVVTL